MKAKWENFSDDEIIEILKNSKNYSDAARKLGYAPNGKIFRLIDNLSKKLKIKLSFKHTGYKIKKDLTNKTFGHLTVIKEDIERTSQGKGIYWLCQCDCGNPVLKSVLAANLTTGKI